MSAAPLVRQPLATALAAALLALGVTGVAWASSSANAGVEAPRDASTSQTNR